MKEYHLPRGINKDNKCLSFYATQQINPFLNSRISANHFKMEGHSANAHWSSSGQQFSPIKTNLI